MQDMTVGSIPKHIIRMAVPLALGMIFQTMYVLVDLYFVAQIGDTAIAGVSAAANLQFIILALTQVLGVGTMVLISHAAGRKDHDDANLIFNQSLVLAAFCAAITLLFGFAFAGRYMQTLGASPAVVAAGTTYLYWFLPALALQFALVTMGSALRGTGIARPTMIVQIATVVLNAILAPVLVAGWGTGRPMGVAGAGLASTISIAFGVVLMLLFFARLEHFVGYDRSRITPHLETWKRMLRIGLPAGGEFALMFVYTGVIYLIVRDFGPQAQAGFGVGSRVMQSVILPAMAIAFAAAPIAGQNIGAGKPERAEATFRSAAVMGSVLMFVLTVLCQFRGDLFVRAFTKDAAVIVVGAQFLQIISWNFVAQGIIFTCSGMFQALGNTVPAMISSGTRVVTFAVPAFWLSHQAGYELQQLWYLSVATVTLQVFASVLLLRREWQRKLLMAPAAAIAGVEVVEALGA
jgi:putative MATE family efflux protein